MMIHQAKIGQDGAKTGPRWGQDGPKMGPRWSKMEPRWAKMGPRWRQDGPRWSLGGTRWAKIGRDGPTEVAKTVQDGHRWGQDAAKTRENESKKCGHSRQIRCFCKVGTIQRQRRAKNVLMKQVLDRGRTGRREKEPKCGHCRGPKRCGWRRWIPKWIPRGGQDGPRWGQDGPRCGQDARK